MKKGCILCLLISVISLPLIAQNIIYSNLKELLAQHGDTTAVLRVEKRSRNQIVLTGGADYRITAGDDESMCRRLKKRCFAVRDEKGDLYLNCRNLRYENGQIFQHFGHTEQFKLYEAVDGKITHAKVVDTNGSGHGALAGFLMQNGVDTLICGGIGGGAQAALAEAGIKLYGGVSGDADAAVNALLSGNLGYDPNVHCDHHDHEHGEAGHTCGDHGCGKHSCH